MIQLLLSIFVFSTEGDQYVQIPALLFPLACTFTHKKSGGGWELKGSLISCPAGWGAPIISVSYLADLFLMHFAVNTSRSATRSPGSLFPSFTIFQHWETFFLTASPRKPITFCPLSQDGDNWASSHHCSPLSTDSPSVYRQATVSTFNNLCWTINFFQPFSVLSRPWSPSCLVDTGKAVWQSAAPPLRPYACGGGQGHTQKPGCQLQWALWGWRSCCSGTTSAFSWWETGCPGCPFYVSWAVLQLTALRGDCCLSLCQNAIIQQSCPSVTTEG